MKMINTRYIFLDANVFDRYIFQLRIGSLLDLIATRYPDLHLVVCNELFTEIRNVCSRPGKPFQLIKNKGITDVDAAIEKQITIIKLFAAIEIIEPVQITEEVPEDDKNDWYIHNIGKQFNITIVSDDKHLKNIKQKPYPFLTSQQFFDLLK